MKVLMSAYACEPDRGSEPGIGWHWAVQAAHQHDGWVLTRANNRQVIEEELHLRPVARLHVIYHDLPVWARWWKRCNQGVNLYYLIWQLSALPLVRRWHEIVRFDVGHHITLGSLRHMSFLAFIGIPYVWGPIGGGESAPLQFYASFGFMGAVKEMVRDISNLLTRVDPLVRLNGHRASLILATTPETTVRLPRPFREKTQIMPATGVSVETGHCHEHIQSLHGLRLLYVGRLLHWRGVHLAIRAIATLVREGIDVEFTVIGDGPFRSKI
jgi:glycosyltransferase involved in cell wall biosynthesis